MEYSFKENVGIPVAPGTGDDGGDTLEATAFVRPSDIVLLRGEDDVMYANGRYIAGLEVVHSTTGVSIPVTPQIRTLVAAELVDTLGTDAPIVNRLRDVPAHGFQGIDDMVVCEEGADDYWDQAVLEHRDDGGFTDYM